MSSNGDNATALKLDMLGNIYVTGFSISYTTGNDYATIKYLPNGDTAWIRRYNGPGNGTDWATDMAVDYDGNAIITGWSAGLGAGGDYATVKYYPNGDTAWIRRYSGPGNYMDFAWAMVVDTASNIYVTGYSYDSAGQNDDYATIKYYPNGDLAWVKKYDSPDNLDDWARTLTVDDAGCVYVSGSSADNNGEKYIVTIKYYASGDTAWVRRYDGSPGYSDGIACDNNGNIYITGTCYNDYVTIKYYPNGDTAWIRRYNGSGNGLDEAKELVLDDSSNVYITGNSSGSGNQQDIATVKYNSNGTLIWVNRYNGLGNAYDAGVDIALDNDHFVYVAGSCTGVSTDRDYVTIKYYPDGDTAWVRRYCGTENDIDQACAIAIDDSGHVYVTGDCWFGINYYEDYVTIKYTPTGEVDERWITHVSVDQKIDIFPNPCHKVTSISIGQGVEGKEVRIFDISGRLIARYAPCTMPYALDLSSMAPGVYFVQVDGIRAVGKIVITM